MAVGGRTTNTFAEILTEMLRDLAIAQTLPDTDMEFASNLSAQITAKLREPIDAAQQTMPPGQGPTSGAAVGPSPMGPPGGPPLLPGGGGAPPPMPPGAAGPPAGLRNPGPSPDELARLLG